MCISFFHLVFFSSWPFFIFSSNLLCVAPLRQWNWNRNQSNPNPNKDKCSPFIFVYSIVEPMPLYICGISSPQPLFNKTFTTKSINNLVNYDCFMWIFVIVKYGDEFWLAIIKLLDSWVFTFWICMPNSKVAFKYDLYKMYYIYMQCLGIDLC